MFQEKERKALLKNPVGAPAPEELVKPCYDQMANQDAVTKMQFVDLNMWMVGDILLKADKMSMHPYPLAGKRAEHQVRYAPGCPAAYAGEMGGKAETRVPSAYPGLA